MKKYFFFFLFVPLSILISEQAFGLTASEFVAKYKDIIPDDGKLVDVLVKVKGVPASLDPDVRAKEIRYLQSGALKFVLFARGINVISDTWNNEFSAQVHPKVAELLVQRGDVLSVTMISSGSYIVKQPNILPPRKQVMQGITIDDIVCAKDLQLIMKKSDRKPACVKPSSVLPLIERGWGVYPLSN